MHKPQFALENETRKILWDFEAQTDHLIQLEDQSLWQLTKKREPVK